MTRLCPPLEMIRPVSVWLVSVWLMPAALGPPSQAVGSALPASSSRSLPAGTQSDDAVRAALERLDSGQPYEAVELLMQVVEGDPAAAAAYFYLSSIYTETARYDDARRYLERALELDPEQASFHYQLGVIRFREGDRTGALRAFQEAVRLGLGESDGDVWRQIGDVRSQLLEREGALEAYETAVAIEPANARNRLALGQFYLDRGELDLATEHLRVAVDLAPALPEAYASLGLAMRRRGDAEGAVELLTEGLALNPSDQKSRYGLALSLMALGRVAEARTQMEEYGRVEGTIERANTAMDLGSERLEAGEPIEAVRLFEEAVLLAPTYSLAHQRLGEALLAVGHLGDLTAALVALERSVSINPLGAEAYFALGRAQQRLGRPEEALESTRKAIVLDPMNAGYFEQLGRVLGALDRNRDARQALEEAARIQAMRPLGSPPD